MTTSHHIESAAHASGDRAARSRLFTATAFVGVVLAFALPFGTVESCDGEEVNFTGVQLASHTVPPDNPNGELHTKVERYAGLLAVSVFLATVLGLVGAIRGGPPHAGTCATLGLIAMQLLGLAILLSGDAGATLQAGFWLALVSLAGAGVLRLAAAVAARRRAGRRVWGYAVGRCAIALSPTLAVVLMIAIAVLAS